MLTKKEVNIIKARDYIAHSAEGQSWENHKYIRKEYLGNGNWKYFYNDGSSHVSNATGEKEADVKEGAYQTNKAFGNGTQSNSYKTNAGKIMSNNDQSKMTKDRQDMYKGLSNQAQQYNLITQAQNTAAELGNQALRQEQDKANKEVVNQAQDKFTEAYNNTDANREKYLEEEERRKMYEGLAELGRNKITDVNNKKVLDEAQNALNNIYNNADASREQYVDEMIAKRIEKLNSDWDNAIAAAGNSKPGAAPYQNLVNQNVASTQKNAANEALGSYVDSVITEVLEPLRDAGMSLDEALSVVDGYEKQLLGESLFIPIRESTTGGKGTIMFLPGAAEGFNKYSDTVVPALKEYVNDIISSKEEQDFYNSLTPEQQAVIDRMVKKGK